TGRRSVVFSTFLAGRNVAMAGIEKLTGLTITHVPIMVRLAAGHRVRQFLGLIQDEAISIMLYENKGMRAITKL
ncbi:hypothetical protein LX32DRAFT_492112, partial [Colletotrichum zoysiae]